MDGSPGASGAALALHLFVLHVPWRQQAFGTVALRRGDWLRCTAVASTARWVADLLKGVRRA